MCKVSIIIPTYNRTEYLKETVSSILNQSLQDFEIIIIDDSSDNKYFARQNRIAKLDTRIRIIRNKVNKGVSVCRNIGINNSQGEYIHFIDDDDTIGNDTLSHGLGIFKKYKDVDVVMLSSSLHPDSIKSTYIYHALNKVFKEHNKKEKRITAEEQWTILRRSPSINSMFCKKEVFSNTQFEPNLSYGEDAYLWMKLLQQNKVFYKSNSLGASTVFVRKHSGNHLSVASPNTVISYLQTVEKDFFPLKSKSKIELQWRLLHCYLKLGNFPMAFKSFLNCLGNPFHFMKRLISFIRIKLAAQISLLKFKFFENRNRSEKSYRNIPNND